MGFIAKIANKSIDPIRTIEWVIAILTLIGGAYVFTPVYAYSISTVGPSALASALGVPILTLVWGGLLVVGAIFIIVGLKKDKPQFRSHGLFIIILTRFFQILATLFAGAFFPITWIYPLTLVMIMVVLWGVNRAEVAKRASN